jgi:serine/threonine protein kinase/DNA-binding NarL/FixJ family response regulator
MNTSQAVDEASGPPPRLKDRYRLVQQLGRGSMGLVYRAHDETLDRDVAIKFVLPKQLAGDQASDRFLREARAVARLSHPNIMALYDVDREGTWHYAVLEHIAGRNLREHAVERDGSLPLTESLQVIRETLAALAYAHAHGIIHRDIKPENIMVTLEGHVKVTDFGLAVAHGDVRLTQEGMIVGTMLYLAPESVLGQAVDQRADLYAVGAMFYELLAGRPPFSGDDTMSTFAQILNAPLTSPHAIDSTIPLEIDQLIVKLLARDPKERFGSADEVLAALHDLSAVEPPSPGAPPTVEDASMVERIARSSSTHLPQARLKEDEAEDTSSQELLVYAAVEDTVSAIEIERRRLARLLQSNLSEPLNLLLAQAGVYEQTLGANPAARMAVSVLSSLARQLQQQLRDLETDLHPTLLETLGLEPALEALAAQVTRAHGLQVELSIERLRERLPAPIELVLFRATQSALDRAIRRGHASRATIHLEQREAQFLFSLHDNSTAARGADVLRDARRRIEQLGGSFETRAQDGFELIVRFTLEAPIQLTAREMDVIRLLAQGLSNKEIARRLSITPRTVNFHLDNIYSKLGVGSRTEAAIYALRHGWVRPAPDAPV